jgi:hypothetical protein
MKSHSPTPSPNLIDTDCAASYICMSTCWLKAARFRPELAGPPFIKIGRCVRYDVRDLDRWISERKFRGTHEIPSINLGELS